MRGVKRFWRTAVLIVVIVVSGTASVYFARHERDETPIAAVTASNGTSQGGGGYTYERLADPPRTVARTAAGAVMATMTDGSRTVMLTGPVRSFTEPKNTTVAVTSPAWIRLAPHEWAAGAEHSDWFGKWLAKNIGNTEPDVLAVALEYTDGVQPQQNSKKLRVAGDASFGPDSAEGREERSDFYDYLGVSWDFPDGKHQDSSTNRYGSLDCSGFVRMVYGYREGYPLRGTNTAGVGLPRRAWAMSELGPGTQIVPDTKQAATAYSRLQPGDLLFFNLEPNLGPQVSHTGIYLGIDSDGHRRVLSSRKVANGPTFGDTGGVSLIDGGGKYSQAWRAAKRL